jgi:hypothetical protein
LFSLTLLIDRPFWTRILSLGLAYRSSQKTGRVLLTFVSSLIQGKNFPGARWRPMERVHRWDTATYQLLCTMVSWLSFSSTTLLGSWYGCCFPFFSLLLFDDQDRHSCTFWVNERIPFFKRKIECISKYNKYNIVKTTCLIRTGTIP